MLYLLLRWFVRLFCLGSPSCVYEYRYGYGYVCVNGTMVVFYCITVCNMPFEIVFLLSALLVAFRFLFTFSHFVYSSLCFFFSCCRCCLVFTFSFLVLFPRFLQVGSLTVSICFSSHFFSLAFARYFSVYFLFFFSYHSFSLCFFVSRPVLFRFEFFISFCRICVSVYAVLVFCLFDQIFFALFRLILSHQTGWNLINFSFESLSVTHGTLTMVC